MEAVYLDTHVAVWLFAGETEKFSGRTRELLELAPLVISPFVLLEIQYLREAGKVDIRIDRFLRDMKEALDLRVCDSPFVSVALAAAELSWTRDPFDRMIVAQAKLNDAKLITRDKIILNHYSYAFWSEYKIS